MLSKLNTHTVLSLVTFVVGLAVTNGLITNDDGKVITGAASALVALGLLLYGAVKEHGSAKVEVAKLANPPAA